jgi:hypothetical protein
MPDGYLMLRTRPLFHPWGPAALLASAATAVAVAVLTGGPPVAVVWWLLLGLVSGYAISGSV